VRYCIGIPTINRADLLAKSIADLSENCPDVEVVVVDNGKQDLYRMLERSKLNFELFENPENKGVAGSWNQIARYGFRMGYSWAWIVNDDVVLGKNQHEIERLCADSESPFEAPPVIAAQPWCSFLLPEKVWSSVGEFDEGYFPAYFEDDDYMERMKEKGLNVIWRDLVVPRVFRNSQTIQKDPSLNLNFSKNQERFVEKWGAEALYRLMTKKA
jgi:GT2 family glycosyltransferase